jgi:hypothetical protein
MLAHILEYGLGLLVKLKGKAAVQTLARNKPVCMQA